MTIHMVPLHFLTARASGANFVSPWFDRQKWHLVSWGISWTAVAASAGTLSIEETNDPNQINDATFAPNPGVVALTTVTVQGNGASLVTGATAGSVIVNVSEGAAFERLKFTWSGGGAGALFDVWLFARAR